MSLLTVEPPHQAPPPTIAPQPGPPPSSPSKRPAWSTPCLVALLVGTGVLYVWGLGNSGWANSFYSGAVQAGTKSWKAFFYGSSDASNFITVDKPPASLWVMELSARVFGVNAWSILVPQALEGVAAVGVLYAAVRRWFGDAAGLLAGLVLALTPVAALMFRFNNPDALLTLLLVCSAYALVRALERGTTMWIVVAGAFIGFGFITKMLQALLVVPGFTLVYLVCANASLRRRIWQVLLAAATVLVSGLWWVVAVMAVPAANRPYIGGSQHNSLWELIFGYNGFGRLTGNETGSVGGGGQATAMWGPTGWTRMFNESFGGQISWLLPAALVLLAAVAVFTWRAPRTDRTRAAIGVWGSWLVVTSIVFSLGQGIIHPYYTVALAPPIGALTGIGVTYCWRRRDHLASRIVLAATLAVTSIWTLVLLQRTPEWHSWLGPAVLVAGLTLAAALLVRSWVRGRAGKVLAAGAIVVALAGSGSYAFATAATTHSGAIPTAGPTAAAGAGPGGGFRGFPGGFPSAAGGRAGRFGGGFPGVGRGGFPGGGRGGFPGGGGNAGGSAGGLLDGSTPTAEVTDLLSADAGRYTWVAAAVGSNSAAGYQLATGDPVMSIGGFNGTDPAPTLDQFQAYVASGQIHYFIGGGFGGGRGGFGPGGSSSMSREISNWVESHFTAKSVGGITLYDLSQPTK